LQNRSKPIPFINLRRLVASALLQFDGVAFQLVIERRSLNSEKFGRLFLVAVTLSESLQDGIPFDIIEALHAGPRRSDAVGLLQGKGQLDFRRKLFYTDHILAGQDNSVLDCVLQFSNVSRPGIIQEFLERLRRKLRLRFV
jgi:hypothetical protein